MNIPKPLSRIIQSPFFLSFVCFLLFLSMTSYKFGWDDQHLEIPLLKSLIDPSLYQGDYYVQSLKQNFITFFFPILAKLITVDQIPITYHVLWLISRFVMFYFIFKLWLLVSNDRLKAFSAVMVFILMARVQEFLYRTFSHQEFALAIIFAGIYYFFEGRIILASLLLGIAANFHALYSLFPMTFIMVYLLCDYRRQGVFKIFKAGGTFILFCLPFLVWMVQKRFLQSDHFDVRSTANWIDLYMKACPQNFIFSEYSLLPWPELTKDMARFFGVIKSYVFLILLFGFNFFFNDDFKSNKKAVCFALGGFALILLCFVFTYLFPHPFFIDLNLERNTQFLLFLLMGFSTIYMIKEVERGDYLNALFIGCVFVLLKFPEQISATALAALIIWQARKKTGPLNKEIEMLLFAFVGISLLIAGIIIAQVFGSAQYPFFVFRNLIIIFAGLILFFGLGRFKIAKIPKAWFILLPIGIFFLQYVGYHNVKLKEELYGQGFWRLQRNWEDMQRFVKATTPKDATIFVPYNMEMGGFRIFSERKIVVCYRDCGIIGFDFKAAVEWQKRIKDVEAYKVQIDQPIAQAIITAITQYHADYVVFLRYLAPKNDTEVFKKIYANDDLVLFKISKAT